MEDKLEIAIQGLKAIIEQSAEQSIARTIAETTLEELDKKLIRQVDHSHNVISLLRILALKLEIK